MNDIKTVLVTGGAGYVGSKLVPELINNNYKVKVIDLFMFGEDVLSECDENPNLEKIKADIRDSKALEEAIIGCDAVIHLACISNDPSFELNPDLGKSINYDCFPTLVALSKKHGVKRFVYASSSSVYGVKSEPNVTEDLPLKPLTDYSKYKALCEDILLKEREPGFATLIVRPATVCGYSKRQRLDVIVNILTNLAYHKNEITVFGGKQMRPNIHIKDMVNFYIQSLKWETEKIDGKIYNAGYHNHTVEDIASMVKKIVGDQVEIKQVETDDNRSYHVSSEKIKNELGFEAKNSIEDAVKELMEAFKTGKLTDPLNNIAYSNIKTMQAINLV